MIGNIAAAHISIEHNFKGINFNVMSACASANHAIGTAMRAIQYGDAEIVISGGTEAAVTPLAGGGFSSMRALSSRNADPQTASRSLRCPAGWLCNERRRSHNRIGRTGTCQSPRSRIIAALAGYGATGDAFHITAPTEDGEGSTRAILMAIKDAGLTPNDIDYINAHGTSTPLNDKGETQAIKTAFGERAYQIKINSTKSMVGHMLGAAAGIEAIACIKTIETGIIHPTMNLINPDPECDLDYVPNCSQ
jgi:3-oxoacyl-[acyl-carrier-protein] synthase II